MLFEDTWPPEDEFYDFLKIIDMQEPGSAKQRTPEGEVDDNEQELDKEDDTWEEAATDSSYSSAPNTNLNTHTEL